MKCCWTRADIAGRMTKLALTLCAAAVAVGVNQAQSCCTTNDDCAALLTTADEVRIRERDRTREEKVERKSSKPPEECLCFEFVGVSCVIAVLNHRVRTGRASFNP